MVNANSCPKIIRYSQLNGDIAGVDMSARNDNTPISAVMVVDDDPAILLVLTKALGRAGFKVEPACDATDALEKFERHTPDIVLIDVGMPGMNGYELCAEMRKRSVGKFLPIVMVTGYDDDASVNRAYEAGATDFIPKPISCAQIGHRVRYMLRASDESRQLQLSNARLSSVMEAVPDLIFRISDEGIYLACEAGANSELVPGHTDLIGRTFRDVMAPADAELSETSLLRAINENSIQQYEYQLQSRDGLRDFEARLVPSGNGEIHAIVRDITDRKTAERQIHYMAYFDTLTELPNRAQFTARLNSAMMYADKNNYSLSVLIMDIDQLKLINDTLGHSTGDGLLISVGDRLTRLFKSGPVSKPDEFVTLSAVARIGGDEFVLFLGRPNGEDDVEVLAQRVLDDFALPHIVNEHEIFVTPTIGIANYPQDGSQAETLLNNADTAMYRAKAAGRNGYRLFSKSMNENAHKRLTMENELRSAVNNNEFELYYQPQVRTGDLRILGAEALLRWNHPERGLIAPGAFIQVAEETGLVVPITQWVLSEACSQAQQWRETFDEMLTISVNVSPRLFLRGDIGADVTQALAATGLPGKNLEIELTESVLMRNTFSTKNMFQFLTSIGVRFSIDDFGTGYSSLSYLKQFPLDTLKIDRAFVSDIDKDAGDTSIVIAIIAMAKGLGLQVIAEGVETRDQYEFLKAQHCDVVQGYWYSRPLNTNGFDTLLKNRSWSDLDVNGRNSDDLSSFGRTNRFHRRRAGTATPGPLPEHLRSQVENTHEPNPAKEHQRL